MYGLHVFLEALTVREHLETNITLFRFGPGGQLSNAFIHVDHGMILQLTHLIKSLPTDVALKLFEISVSLVVSFQYFGVESPVGTTAAEQHITVNGVNPPEVSPALSPLLELLIALHTAEGGGVRVVALEVVFQLLAVFEQEVAAPG